MTSKPLPQVRVFSYLEAQDILVHPWDYPVKFKSVLSINDPDTDVPQGLHEFRGTKLVLLFHDLEHEYQSTHFGILPSEADVEKILVFGKAAKDPIMVHCAAGISRSTASAVLIMAMHRRPSRTNAREIFDNLIRVRPNCLPNSRIIDLGDTLAGWKGHLVEEHTKRFSRGGGWR